MIAEDFLNSSLKRFLEYKTLGDKTLERLTADQMHVQPNEISNSIAMIVQHMHGNMLSRWTNFLTEDGEKDWRKRDDEFKHQNHSKEELMILWNEGWAVFLQTIDELTTEDLNTTITIRQQPLTVVDALIRQMGHYSYHVGQMVYLGKWLIGSDWPSLSIPKKK